jgi:hypothetical protein
MLLAVTPGTGLGVYDDSVSEYGDDPYGGIGHDEGMERDGGGEKGGAGAEEKRVLKVGF